MALLFAALFAVITFVSWVLGIPGKFSQRPSNPKSWWQVAHVGPLYFACMFGFFFLMFYAFQRLGGRPFGEPKKTVFICPACFTPQYEHERRCTCQTKLEPLENWKWK